MSINKLMYPTEKETVIPVYIAGSNDVVATLFPRYIGEDAFESAKLRAQTLKGHGEVNGAGMPAGDVEDPTGERIGINPGLISKFGAAKQVAVPDGIATQVKEANDLLAKDELTDDEVATLKKDKSQLNFYFSTCRAFYL